MNKNFRLDWLTVFTYLGLVGFGITNIYSSTYAIDQPELFNLSRPIGKQIIFFIVSLASIGFILVAPSKLFERFSSVLYLIAILLLLGLFLFGSVISGARSWYVLGGVSLQPAEFSKVAVALAVAKLLSEIQIDIRKMRSLLQVVLIVSIPVGLIILQPDPGSALVFGAFLFVLYREGLPTPYMLVITGLFIFFILTLVYSLPFVFVSIIFTVIGLYFFFTTSQQKSCFFSLPRRHSLLLSLCLFGRLYL